MGSINTLICGQKSSGRSRLMTIVFKFPLLIGSIYRSLHLNEIEEANQFQYLNSGGFIMGGIGDVEKHLSQVLANGGLVERKDFWSDILPEDHPIYSTFFRELYTMMPKEASALSRAAPLFLALRYAQMFTIFIDISA